MISMASLTTSETIEHNLFGPHSETITPCVANQAIKQLPWMMKPRLRIPRNSGAKFAHLESNVSVIFEPTYSYSYLEDANDLQEDFLDTIVGVASRKWVYVVDNIVIRSVIDTFMNTDKVDSIYGHVENEAYSLLVFISVSQYDDLLAEQLATYEIELEDRFTSATFEYHYVPVALGYDSIINNKDTCYYKRNGNE